MCELKKKKYTRKIIRSPVNSLLFFKGYLHLTVKARVSNRLLSVKVKKKTEISINCDFIRDRSSTKKRKYSLEMCQISFLLDVSGYFLNSKIDSQNLGKKRRGVFFVHSFKIFLFRYVHSCNG